MEYLGALELLAAKHGGDWAAVAADLGITEVEVREIRFRGAAPSQDVLTRLQAEVDAEK